MEMPETLSISMELRALILARPASVTLVWLSQGGGERRVFE